jgi:hypothetical protein
VVKERQIMVGDVSTMEYHNCMCRNDRSWEQDEEEKRQSFEKARGMEKRQAGSKYTGFS